MKDDASYSPTSLVFVIRDRIVRLIADLFDGWFDHRLIKAVKTRIAVLGTRDVFQLGQRKVRIRHGIDLRGCLALVGMFAVVPVLVVAHRQKLVEHDGVLAPQFGNVAESILGKIGLQHADVGQQVAVEPQFDLAARAVVARAGDRRDRHRGLGTVVFLVRQGKDGMLMQIEQGLFQPFGTTAPLDVKKVVDQLFVDFYFVAVVLAVVGPYGHFKQLERDLLHAGNGRDQIIVLSNDAILIDWLHK